MAIRMAGSSVISVRTKRIVHGVESDGCNRAPRSGSSGAAGAAASLLAIHIPTMKLVLKLAVRGAPAGTEQAFRCRHGVRPERPAHPANVHPANVHPANVHPANETPGRLRAREQPENAFLRIQQVPTCGVAPARSSRESAAVAPSARCLAGSSSRSIPAPVATYVPPTLEATAAAGAPEVEPFHPQRSISWFDPSSCPPLLQIQASRVIRTASCVSMTSN